MKNFVKVLISLLFVAICSNFVFGQSQKTNSSNADFLQERDLNKYSQEHFWCGGFRKSDECNKEKMADFVWECWKNKTLCYLTITFNGVDSSFTKNLLVEPNKQNKWTVLSFGRRYQPFAKPQLETFPTAYFIDLEENKGERVLTFRNKQKKVIEKFLY